jgi:hypothetical protein
MNQTETLNLIQNQEDIKSKIKTWWTGRDLNPRPSAFWSWLCQADDLRPFEAYQTDLPAHENRWVIDSVRLIAS